MTLASRFSITYNDNMKNIPSPDPAPSECPSAYRQVAHYLLASLPPPPDDTPEWRALRDRAAEAALAALRPANEMEAMLAAQFIAASAQALDCLRLAHLPGTDTAVFLKCSAQAAGMMRQSQAALRTLERLRTEREWTTAVKAPPPAARPVPEKPKGDTRAAPAASRAGLPGLPRGPLSVDRLLEEIAGGAMNGAFPTARLNPGKHDFETMVRRAGSR